MEQNINLLIYNSIEKISYENDELLIYTPYYIFSDDEIKLNLNSNELEKKDFTKDIINILYNYCMNNEFPDIKLFAYSPENNNLYMGEMLYSEIKENNYKFTNIKCNYNVAKYNEINDEWESVYAIIRTDGSYVIEPESFCNACIIFLTKKEWDNYKHPPFSKKYNKYAPFYKWNFAKEEWYDTRTIDEMKDFYESKIYEMFAHLDNDIIVFYLNERTITCYSKTLKFTLENYYKKEFSAQKYDGIKFIENMFNVKYKENTNDFPDSFYIEQFLKAIEYIDGQREVWLQLPELNQTKFDLTKTSGWDDLIEYFENWFDRLYPE